MNRSWGPNQIGKGRSVSRYLERKGIGNVTEGQGFADKRKRKILNTYKKLVRKNKQMTDLCNTPRQKKIDIPGVQHAGARDDMNETRQTGKREPTIHYSKNKKTRQKSNKYDRSKETSQRKEANDRRNSSKMNVGFNRYSPAEQQHERQTDELEKRLKDKNARREARETALKRYQDKKEGRHQMLRKRTRKGQPIIKYHMHHLLQKIQSQNV